MAAENGRYQCVGSTGELFLCSKEHMIIKWFNALWPVGHSQKCTKPWQPFKFAGFPIENRPWSSRVIGMIVRRSWRMSSCFVTRRKPLVRTLNHRERERISTDKTPILRRFSNPVSLQSNQNRINRSWISLKSCKCKSEFVKQKCLCTHTSLTNSNGNPK